MAVYYRQIEDMGRKAFQRLCRGKGIVHVRITRRERMEGCGGIDDGVLEEDADMCRLTITQTFLKRKFNQRTKGVFYQEKYLLL